MNGIIINYKGQEINISTAFLSTIFLYQDYGTYFVEVGGTERNPDGTGMSYKWLDTKIALGETIEVNIVGNENKTLSSTVTEKAELPESVTLLEENNEEFHSRLLDKFYKLQNILIKKGLL
ncbi:hypothetical protein [Sphingobacterium griseoflavum]|uniref:Uncharacterized protein n=1 Tax=Sphingobacterium griseoflavum TaxID=1474952 RepID=A0ABQ3HW00_9SPHI|nr:hypothetical protein [Sphingobacterium griseoflavum]GHE37080.1 hypothetical protein GCM10017764_20370 [Sphingobacterium griseoflavum]